MAQQNPDPEKHTDVILSAAVDAARKQPKPAPNGYKAEAYRETILVWLQMKVSHERIAEFLRGQGVSIHQTAISKYLRAHPPTEEEKARAARLLAFEAPAVSHTEKPKQTVQKERSTTAPTPVPGQRPSEKRRPRPIDTDDGIDYSFLNMEGRPFTIKPKQPEREKS